MNSNYHIEIPTWDNGVWTETVFDDRREMYEFVKSLFKEPGKYEFDDTSYMFNEQARNFRANRNVYNISPYLSNDFIKYWDGEKKKCRNGVIFRNGEHTWYLTRDYYMWINFLPIFDKIKKKYDFPQVWDIQYHVALYECLAELDYKHIAICKKRQCAMSYFHCAKLINQLWFEEGVQLKIGASLKKYVSDDFVYLKEYRNFLNEHTAWYRPMSPDTALEWTQQIEMTQGGKKMTKGLKGHLVGISFEHSAVASVGGPTTLLYHEEAGIAPLMDKTFEFVRPALQMGEITTGTFIASGSVGELKDADTLKNMIYHPEDNGIYAIETNLIDENGSRGMSGLFLPEQWAMPPYIDDFGNSQVEEALDALNKQFEEWKKTLSPQQYQLRVSQHPRNLRECFASRTVSIFPTALIEDQTIKIKDHEYPYELVDLEEDLYRNEIVVKKATKAPIREWPIRKNAEDKEGAIVVWERPDKEFKPGTYVASIDPVSVGATTESDSLCSIYVYKMPTLVKHMSDRGVENYIEGDKIVCAWCGRFDDLTDTHKRLRLIIEWYRAETLVENNVPQFITYMIHERKQNYLVPESNILFLKEVAPARPNQVKYGWRNVGNFFKRNMLPYLVDYLKEVIHEDCDDAGNVIKKTFGISRIPDIMAMEEMRGYDEKVNTDRLISLASLIAYVQIKISNTKMSERVDNQDDTPVNYDQYKIRSNPFSAIGRSRSPFSAIRKSPFIKMH